MDYFIPNVVKSDSALPKTVQIIPIRFAASSFMYFKNFLCICEIFFIDRS